MATDTQHHPLKAPPHTILLLAEDASLALDSYVRALSVAGYQVVSQAPEGAGGASEGQALTAVVVGHPHNPSSPQTASALAQLAPHIPVVRLTQVPSRPTLAYLRAPSSTADILQALNQALWPIAEGQEAPAAAGPQNPASSTAAITTPGYGLAEEFDLALASLYMAYQPIVDCAHGALFGYEALVRCAPGNLASPPALLAAAESLGRLQELSRQIRAQVAANMAQAPEHVAAHKIFVNLHAQDLLDSSLFDSDAPLSAHAHRIVLEITERTPLEEVPEVLPRIARLRAMGYRIALDDLGAGYAGLSTFAQLEPEVVKLDMALVRDVEKSRTKRHIIVSMVQLCEKLNIHVIAEGIETIAERDVLMALGCQLLQGYYFGRPQRGFSEPTY